MQEGGFAGTATRHAQQLWNLHSAADCRGLAACAADPGCAVWLQEPEQSTPKSMKRRRKIVENPFLELCWLMMISPWSQLGPRWSPLGPRWPRGSIFHWFRVHFGGFKMLRKWIPKWSFLQISLETFFSPIVADKKLKMRIQNNPDFIFFWKGLNPENNILASART